MTPPDIGETIIKKTKKIRNLALHSQWNQWDSGFQLSTEKSVPALLISRLVHYPGFDHISRSSQDSSYQARTATVNRNK